MVTGGDAEPDVVVVAVTYNSAGIVEPFLRALPAALDGIASAEVIVVDNSSADGTPDLVRHLAPWVTVIDAGGNLGYGAGINVGLRHRLGNRGVYVLNPDAVPSPGSVKVLLDAVETHAGAGMTVPRITDSEGTLKFSLRREPTVRRAVGEAVLGGHRAARYPMFGDMIRDPAYYVDGATADWATGAAVFISRPALDAVGLWDEDFFLYSEETDYALRLRDAGLKLRYVWDAVVSHPGGDMETSPFLWSFLTVNRVILYRRRHGPVAGAFYWSAVVANEAARAAMGRRINQAALKALFRGRPSIPE